MNNKKINIELKSMIGKTFQYAGKIYFVKDISIDEENDKYSIITNLSTFDRKLENMENFLRYWQATADVKDFEQESQKQQQIAVLVEQDNDLTKMLIDKLNENINNVKTNPKYIPQAQTINNSINSIIAVAKIRLELLKYVYSNKKV